MSYIGRFAPSPTGSLHLGSLYAALASFLHAKAQQGKWLLRIDDLDTFRNVAGATQSIIDTLQVYGLYWDAPIFYQNQHLTSYHTVINQFLEQNLAYPCSCSRKSLAKQSVYPGYCLKKQIDADVAHSLRIKTSAIKLCFVDEIQGQHQHLLSAQHGDFIIKRKDNIIAYQLAVVVDDFRQNISHVVRGFDLLESTPKQLFLQKLLDYPSPTYCHIPVLIDQQGIKLSKQTFAQAVSLDNPEQTLYLLLTLLKQNPPASLKTTSVENMIQWGIKNWHPDPLKKLSAINRKIY
ncbi:MAG: tRNA glutamyl-Q(34) synthetase GluQRS [Methylococcales symbiont of Iophon sp. n. MRB-2018]|nr:MAG: tRNA glutamyl-Q(34) synthetase GluQRS [Methylococcales symbiont of Iophon sp. n. MRB-2018]KAF3979262.1 MAG: tRNA glutamyl-Q(34) synthetase GluQRS [Methylococcales symbiont of Iophon sp. n. MRB-2018]